MSTPTLSAVELALQAIADKHKSITLENGFKTDVKLVSRHFRDPESMLSSDLPAIFVLRNIGRGNPIEWISEGAYRQKLQVQLFGYLRATGENNDAQELATQAEALLSDMKRLQMTDKFYGQGNGHRGLIRNSNLVEDLNDAGWDAVGALVGLAIEVWIYFDRSLA